MSLRTERERINPDKTDLEKCLDELKALLWVYNCQLEVDTEACLGPCVVIRDLDTGSCEDV